MYVIKNNKKVPVKFNLPEGAVIERFSWATDWPLIIGIVLAVIFVILLVIFLYTNSSSSPKSSRKSSYGGRSPRGGF